ncbi:hypothetical protein Taro_035251 [Colocasia esculenta]|uniref:FAE domain-containing protein n=1 Tax=Colocasia esculenta TaxID=4460 RepID=A0A843WCN1_COLES|nr:hypothetical protein [Colocasia esculenta]
MAMDLAKDLLHVHTAPPPDVLLSNHRADCRREYRLVHVVRTHRGDVAFRCVFQEQDDTDKVHGCLTVQGPPHGHRRRVLKTNITALGPLVLPSVSSYFFSATLVVKLFNDKVIEALRSWIQACF